MSSGLVVTKKIVSSFEREKSCALIGSIYTAFQKTGFPFILELYNVLKIFMRFLAIF